MLNKPYYVQLETAISIGLRCIYCEILLDPYTQNLRNSKTEDHIIPRSKGGNNRKANKVFCCSSCNQLKGNLELHDFYDKIKPLAANDMRYSIMMKNINKLRTYRRSNKRLMFKKKTNGSKIKDDNAKCGN